MALPKKILNKKTISGFKFLKIFFLHFLFFFLGTTFFILLFHTKILSNIDIFFYRGIGLLIISSIFLSAVMALCRKISNGFFTLRDIVLVLALFFCINLAFFTHLPVTAERSISVFLLDYLNKNEERPLTKEEITKIFIDKYLFEDKAIEKRLHEQIFSGNIIQEKEKYKISAQGKSLMKFYKLIAAIFKINKNF